MDLRADLYDEIFAFRKRRNLSPTDALSCIHRRSLPIGPPLTPAANRGEANRIYGRVRPIFSAVYTMTFRGCLSAFLGQLHPRRTVPRIDAPVDAPGPNDRGGTGSINRLRSPLSRHRTTVGQPPSSGSRQAAHSRHPTSQRKVANQNRRSRTSRDLRVVEGAKRGLPGTIRVPERTGAGGPAG